MSYDKKEIVEIISKMDKNKASEIEMLHIRPYVAPKDYCFRVFECDLGEVMKTLTDAGKIGENCLVITSPSAYAATGSTLPKGHKYAYVLDTKMDKLDEFVSKCGVPTYTVRSGMAEGILEEIAYVENFIRERIASGVGAKAREGACETSIAQATEDVKLCANKVEQALRALSEDSFSGYYLNQTIANGKIDTIIALGGGVAMDAGQYLATKFGEKCEGRINLFCVPTALSVNAAFCYKAALRKKDDATNKYLVKYQSELMQPDALLIDPAITLTAGELNMVGAGDLLSCLTASFDWKLNSMVARNYKVKKIENQKESYVDVSKFFNQEICTGAIELIGLLAEHIDDLTAMRKYGEILNLRTGAENQGVTSSFEEEKDITEKRAKEGLRFLCKAYHWVAEQSWIMQHTMWESASEHGMFDCMEAVCETGFIHGKIIGLCVYFMSLLQENEHERAVHMIKRLGLDISLNHLTPGDMNSSNVTVDKLIECLMGLQKFLTKEGYRYTIIYAKNITEDWIRTAIESYYRDFPCDTYGTPNKGIETYKAALDKAFLKTK